MSLAVVRCPACGGASRVPLDALGLMVGCPRCQSPFVAVEDAPSAALPSRAGGASARASTKPVRATPVRSAPKPRPTAAIPIAPPRSPRPELVPGSNSPTDEPVEVPDPEHDPHTPPIGGLPVSVLVGFALMPFGIPLLWFVGPLITGIEASLSLAVPASLAVAAAALCLGVVYTIDWTATTRIKGVLMLVCLAYLCAAGLYFLKKDLMDRFQGFFGKSNGWVEVAPPESRCRVRMPGEVVPAPEQPLPGVELAEGRRATHQTEATRTYFYFVAASKPAAPPFAPNDAWFDEVGKKLKADARDPTGKETWVKYKEHPGRQWELKLGGSDTVRIVQVFVINGRVYYLSVEGPELAADDQYLAKPFFDSFSFDARQPRK